MIGVHSSVREIQAHCSLGSSFDKGAHPEGAVLVGASLRCSDLKDVNLAGVDFTGYYRVADLSGAKHNFRNSVENASLVTLHLSIFCRNQ